MPAELGTDRYDDDHPHTEKLLTPGTNCVKNSLYNTKCCFDAQRSSCNNNFTYLAQVGLKRQTQSSRSSMTLTLRFCIFEPEGAISLDPEAVLSPQPGN